MDSPSGEPKKKVTDRIRFTRANMRFSREKLTINVPVVYMAGDEKSREFQGPPLPVARVTDLPPSKSLSPSAK
jgi:hypothetical protein